MLKIGLLGVGHLGKIHLRLISELSAIYELTGFYDPDSEIVIPEEFSAVRRFDSVDELIAASDCVDIVTPTIHHFELAAKAIRRSKHVFIEKPVTQTVDEAKTLMQLAAEAGVQVQVGHVERFNPAFISALPYINRPMFIEVHRLAQYNPRGTDVSVVLDLMIHDLDLVLSVVKSNIKRVAANGVAVISDSADIANARVEFDNGCVANLTASRISKMNMRKVRMFQRNGYIAVDLLDKTVEIIHHNDEVLSSNAMTFTLGENENAKKFTIEKPGVPVSNAIRDELSAFAQCITNNEIPPVSIEDAYRSMELATLIIDRLKTTSPGSTDF